MRAVGGAGACSAGVEQQDAGARAAPVWYSVAMSTWWAKRDQFSLKRRWLRSWLSTGTDLPVRILRQMPLATCSQQSSWALTTAERCRQMQWWQVQ